MSDEIHELADEYWHGLPADLKKRLSIHDFKRAGDPLFTEIRRLKLEIDRLNRIYISAVKGRRDFRQAYREERKSRK